MNEKTLRTALRTGRVDAGFTTGRGGRIAITDADAVMRAFRANRNDAQDRRAGQQPASLVAIELRLKEARARKVEHEADEQAGTTVPRAEVRLASYEVAKAVRENLENIPDRVSGLLAAETNPAAVRAILATEIRRALESLADALER